MRRFSLEDNVRFVHLLVLSTECVSFDDDDDDDDDDDRTACCYC